MNPSEPITAVAARCEGCGSTLSAVAASVRCDFCGHQQLLNPAQLAQLSQYQSAALRLNASAQQELSAISQMQALHGVRGPQSRNVLWILMACTSTPVILAVAFVAVGMASGISNDVLKAVAEMIVMVGFFVGVGGFFVWYYGGTKKTVALPRATQAAICPTCGAPTAFVPGQVIERCKFCSAAAVPGTALQRAVLDASEHAARLARLERYRAERRVVSGYANIANSTAAIYPWVIVTSLGLPVVGGAIWATYSTVTDSDPAPIGVLVALWVMALGMTIAGILYTTMRAKRRDRWRHVQDQLATKLNGVTVKGSDAALNWMDAFWACPFPVQDLMLCDLGSSTLGMCQGYPVLLLLNPVRPGGMQAGKPEAEVLLGTRFSGCVDDCELPNGPELEGLRTRLGAAGYTLKSYGGGLHASASTMALDTLPTVPEQALELVGVAEQLARYAIVARAQAVLPMAAPVSA
jgi:hypothetical protein